MSKTNKRPNSLGLSPHEIECLKLYSEGLSFIEIAERMEFSEFSITFWLRSARGKIKMPTNASAIARAVRLGILE